LAEQTDQRRQPSFAGGFFLSLVNPKGYAAAAALFSGFVLIRGRFELDAAAKLIVLVAVTTAVNTAWLFAGAALTQFLREPHANRAINAAFAVLLVASVAATLLF
jgi:threonine/homoserine/homoserine lactone efflux protein